MKFTLSWLKEHLDTDASAEEIAATLTAIGLEVEEVTNPAEAIRPFKVAKVLSAEPHPQADKLQVLTVDNGTEQLQVVCGAPNAREGLVGVFGGPGTYVPGPDFTLGNATIRGVDSFGMMCSARELELGEDHDGIIELPADAPVGQSYANYAHLDDPVFDVNVLANRPDCMGVYGIARDLAAAGLGSLKLPTTDLLPHGDEEPSVGVTIEEGSGCHAFWRREIRGVKNGQSPDWLQRRLKAVGQKPISALVDITNYFTLDQARPLHVYDVAKLQGDIVVRRGRGEADKFMALNDKEYEPTEHDIVIADDRGAIGLGGVIGGEATGVDETTDTVLVESAWFDAETIAKTGQRHNLVTDARMRFERGIDPASTSEGVEDPVRMMIAHAGGVASTPRITNNLPRDGYPYILNVVSYRPQRLEELAGIQLSDEEQLAILARLSIFSTDVDSLVEDHEDEAAARAAYEDVAREGAWLLHVPSWRPDIEGESDVVEEIARLHGFDKIPTTALPRDFGVARPTATRGQVAERRLRRTAAARGLHEAITWSFISEKQAEAFGGGAHVLANPISEDLKVMRPSLLPGLAAAARRNLDRGQSSVRLFEIGRRYLADGEKPTATLLLVGEAAPRGWQAGKARAFTAYDAKAEAYALLDAAGAPTANLSIFEGAGDDWHPGRSASLGLGPKKILARFGELHPALLKTLDLPEGSVAAEIYLDAIPAPRNKDRARAAYAPPALQPVSRDFAFIVPEGLQAAQLERAVAGAEKKRIVATRIFDRFEGKDGLSLAIEVTLQPGDKSFTEEELSEISQKIVTAAEAKGAKLRG
ncbi:phenylalanine--tRNA ligase subunit beta [Sphingomicrobium aestuariivivum]|uniref:phenylalanine--tRNA ligase subunit beta n=1 Tax=Sphingomicrobium aestuariivivum TaxID=1582356 RepID=UPI001FD6FD0B|nr:phenylalanine--tRNA ligase subunit beta [Sphingomicrobium aestuariivivum]MCJ8191184.1 phenylalanine--tRNA ligase subunit beta [Sphingomicrobium aestuariivivum]